MAISLTNLADKVTASVIVAADGSGDTTDIQTGMDLVPSGGGSVWIKKGTYTVTSQIDIPANTKVMGEGWGTEVKNGITTTSKAVLECHADGGITIDSIYVNGDKDNNTTAAIWGIGLRDKTLIFNCKVEDMRSAGIFMYNGENSCNVISCEVLTCDASGLRVAGANNSIRDCYLHDNSNEGILTMRNSESVIHGNKIIDNAYSGVYLYECNRCNVIGNIIRGNDQAGIWLFQETAQQTCNNNGILGNQVSNSGWAGIRIEEALYNIFNGNNSYDDQGTATQTHGIQEIGTSDYNVITGNTAKDNTTANYLRVGENTIIGVNGDV